MKALAHWVILSSGWPRRIAAMLAGAAGGLAMAPVDFVPALVIPMTAAVWLIDGCARHETNRGLSRLVPWRSCRAAAAIGWWWGFGYFLAGLWWLGAAFLVEPEKDAWALPFGVLGVPAMLACFPAFGFAVARLLWSPTAWRIVALTAGLGVSEWLRGWMFTGFPWNAFGMAFGGNLVLAQFASVVGLQGLTFLAIAICAAPATLADPRQPGQGSLRAWLASGVAAVGALFLLGFGAVRLAGPPPGHVPDVRLRIMQPAVPQDDSFSYANKDKILADYLQLSETPPGLSKITHLIWPESAFPFILSRDPDALSAIGEALPAGTVLITGAARVETDPGRDHAAHYFNSIEVVASGGSILDEYDKVHLVPFGEYLPFGAVLRHLGLTHFVHIPGGFEPGAHRRLMEVPGLPPVAAVICYEAIFSGAVLPAGSVQERQRAGVLLNVTNDGWFGETSGPYQHLAQARLRSIENGLPLVRAANTGISAIIDPYGRVTKALPLGARGVLDGDLPQRIPPTLFEKQGAVLILVMIIMIVLISLFTSDCRDRIMTKFHLRGN